MKNTYKNNFNGKKWSKEEDAILIQKYPIANKKEILELLPDRTWEAIATRSIKKLGLSRNLFDWTEEEDKILKERYPNSNREEILASLPRRTWQGIQSRASKILSLSRNIGEWNEKEISIMLEHYPSGGSRKIKLLLPNRTVSSILTRASILGISKIHGDCDMSQLLSQSPVSFYWLGLLLADGHFNPKTKRCKLVLAKKDEETIKKFSKFICTDGIKNGQHNSIGVDLYSKEVIPELCRRFSIQSNKTCNPPDISKIENDRDLMTSMLIGLIDGDGCIYKTKGCNVVYMTISCHMSWEGIYKKFINFVIDNFKNNGTNPHCLIKFTNKKVGKEIRKYLVFTIMDNFLLKELKKEAIKMSLPIMSRKWDKVNLDYISEREGTPIIMKVIKEMYNRGMDKKEIIKETGYTASRVGWAIKKLRRSS